MGGQHPVALIDRLPARRRWRRAPVRVITHANGLYGPQGLAQTPDGQVLVANTYAESIATFATMGDTTPSTILSGPATLLSFPIGVDVDAAGRLYVANQFGGVNVYAPGASGNMAPLMTIAGAATGLAAPGAIAVTPPLYIATRSLPRATLRRHYHAQLFAGLGRAPLHWVIVRGRLPRGLKLTKSGQIVGTLRRATTVSVTFQVTDSSHQPMRARRTLKLTITRSRIGG